MVYHPSPMAPAAEFREFGATTSRGMLVTAALLALLLSAAGAFAFDSTGAEAIDVPDDQQALEREQAQKLRRTLEELESRRAEAVRRLEAELLRQREISRLRGDVSALVRRESYVGHEAYWTRRERDSVSRDPADHSAMARRSNIDHQLYQYNNELDRTGALRQSGTSQLNGLQLR